MTEFQEFPSVMFTLALVAMVCVVFVVIFSVFSYQTDNSLLVETTSGGINMSEGWSLLPADYCSALVSVSNGTDSFSGADYNLTLVRMP